MTTILLLFLDTNLTPELIEEGFVREIIKKQNPQTMRKEAGFEVMDKIRVLSLQRIRLLRGFSAYTKKKSNPKYSAEEVVYNEVKGYTKDWKINSEGVKLGVEKLSITFGRRKREMLDNHFKKDNLRKALKKM